MPISKNSLDKWLRECGTVCPCCGADINQSGVDANIEVLDDSVYVDLWCSKCEAEWSNAYRLSNPVMSTGSKGESWDKYDEVVADWEADNAIPGYRWEGPGGFTGALKE